MSDTQQQNKDPLASLSGDVLSDAIAKDGATILTQAGTEARSAAAAVLAAVKRILPLAVASAEGINEGRSRTASFAAAVITLRSSIIIEGTPDWNGRSAVYKLAVQPLIEASRADDDAYITARDRLQKAVSRALPATVLSSLEGAQDLSEEQRKRLLTLHNEEKGTKDATLSPVLAAMRDAMPDSRKRKQRKQAANVGETAEQAEAREQRDAVQSFAASIATVPMGDAVTAMQSSLRTLAAMMTASGEKSYGTKGKGAVSDGLRNVAEVASLLAKYNDGATLSGTENMLLAVLSGTEQEPEPEQQPEPEQPQQQRKRSASQRKRMAARKRSAAGRGTRKRTAAGRK